MNAPLDRRPAAAASSTTRHLDWLEEEAIFILREVGGDVRAPGAAVLGRQGLVRRAAPGREGLQARDAAADFEGRLPFPLLHVDTGHNFPEVIEFRDRRVAETGRAAGRRPPRGLDRSAARCAWRTRCESRNGHQTVTLLEAIEEHRFDALIGGARRDEEKARAKERIFSHRDSFGQWQPKDQRPELWTLFNTRSQPGEHLRAFPISNWTELDVWLYIAREQHRRCRALLRARARGGRAARACWCR